MGRKKNKKEEIEEVEEIETSEATELTSELDEEEAENAEMTVEIDGEVYQKIMHWIQKASGEVSGLGKVQMINGIMKVTSAILIDQKNTGASTETTAAAIGKAMFELKDEPGHLNFWWHSHVDFDVFWSGTDMDTIQELGKHGWFLSTVLNKKEELKTAYYQKGTGFIPKVFVDDIPTSIAYEIDAEKIEKWDKEFDDKVEEFSYVSSSFPSPHYNGFSHYSFKDEEEDDVPAYRSRLHYGEQHMYGNDAPFDDDLDEFKETLLDTTDFSEEEINQMILDEIGRQEKQTTKTKRKRGRKS